MIGVDIVSINRIEKIVNKHEDLFLTRILNESEIKLVKIDSKFNIHRIAGFFAAKEALSKALKCGIGKKIGFLDITIKKDKLGAPEINLGYKLNKIFDINHIHLSISHDRGYAIAYVLIEKNILNTASIYLSILSKKITNGDLISIANIDLTLLKKISLLNLASPNIALFLSITFGLFGIDRFYIKDYKKAFIKLALSPILILWLIDIGLITNDTRKNNFKMIKNIYRHSI